MYIQIMTIAAEGVSMDERQILCDECAAVCARLAGVQATEWSVNHATNTVCGLVRWSEQEMIAGGTETLRLQVAALRDADRILRCREIPCPTRRQGTRPEWHTKPNNGFVHYPPDYDPRG